MYPRDIFRFDKSKAKVRNKTDNNQKFKNKNKNLPIMFSNKNSVK